MADRIVVLGAGTGGTLIANRRRRRYSDRDVTITVVDQDDRHVYQPGLLFVPFGLAGPGEIVKPRHEQLHHGIEFDQSGVDSVQTEQAEVRLLDRSVLGYDVLIVATGAQLLPGETEGMTGPGWMENVFTFYSLEGATALHPALERMSAGRLVINVVDLPIKCPVAPLEFAFLADCYFHARGIRDRIDITYVTPRFRSTAVPTSSPGRRAWGTTSTSSPPMRTRCSPTRHPTSSCSATPPTCRSRRRDPSPISRARSWSATSPASWRANRSGRAGPMSLLQESRINHLGRLMFQSLHWHALLPGRDIPGITPAMSPAGKQHPSGKEAP